MKIKLSANSIVNVSKELEEINLNHGYSIGNVDTVGKSNWTKKILGKTFNIRISNTGRWTDVKPSG